MASGRPSSRMIPDWLLCADWLVRCHVLPVDHPASKQTAQLLDLVHALRDGVVLCELVNTLQPGALSDKDYSKHPQISLFLFKKNAQSFLRVCRSVFQLKEPDLFQQNDLMDLTNFWKVIRTLSKLSHCRIVQRTNNIVPFTIDGKESQTNYINLDSMGHDDDFDEDDAYTMPSSYQKMEEDVYGRLMDSDYVRPAALLEEFTMERKPKSHRDMCISELIHSEGKYIEALKMIKDKFMGQLRPVIAPQDHAIIFKNIEKLYSTHMQFNQDLTTSFNKESTYTIADVFIMNKEKLLVYGDYCANLITAQELLNKLCQTSANIQKCVLDCQAAANDSQFRLWELLTVPMQRVLKYHLFLKELIKNTDADLDHERKSLHRALAEIEDLSLFVNEVTRDNEMLLAINHVAESISDLSLGEGFQLKDYGRLLTDGELRVKTDSAAKQPARYVFLMDKLLLICKPIGEAYKFKAFVPLANYELEETLSAGKTNSSFGLKEQGGRAVYVFTAKNADMRSKWIAAINLAKDNVSPRFAHETGHKFVMTSFTSPTICDVCRKLLRGVFFQGYRCKNTNLNVHKECLEKAKDMAGPPTTLSRPARRASDLGFSSLNSESSFSKLTMSPGGSKPQQPQFRENVPKRMSRAETIIGVQPAVTARRTMPPRTVSMSSAEHDDGDHIYDNSSSSNYMNELTLQSWYAGDLSRAEAEEKLRTKPNGTFLVRISTTKQDHILSIRYDTVFHSVINRASSGQYYFKRAELFRSIMDLVAHYRTHSLEAVFKEVKTCLVAALTEVEPVVETRLEPGVLGYCVALYDYAARSTTQLSLREKDRIAIISKAGEARGWWKGRLGSQAGYFPYAYVEEIH